MKYTNNAQAPLKTNISAWANTIVLDDGYGDLFPSTGTFRVTIEKKTAWVTTKREIAECTSRTGDSLIVSRAVEACPASDTAKTQTQTAFSFDVGDIVSLNLTAQEIDEINSKVSVTDLQNRTVEAQAYPWSSLLMSSPIHAPLPIVNPGMDGNGSITSSWWLGGNPSSGWCADIVGTGAVSFDNWKLKLETLGSGSYIEARNTDGWYTGVTAQSLSITPNTTYVVEFDWITQYVSGDSSDGFTVKLLTQSAPWVSAGEHNVFSPRKIDGLWHHKTEFTTSATAAYMNISPIIYWHSGAATLQMKAWIDNIVIYKKSEGVSLSYLRGTSGKILWFNADWSPAVLDTPPVSKLSNIPDERYVSPHPPSFYSKEVVYAFNPDHESWHAGNLNIPNSHSTWWLLETKTGWTDGAHKFQTAYGDYVSSWWRGADIFYRKSVNDTTWTGWSPIWPDTLLNTAGELTLGSGQSTIFSQTIPADWLNVGDTLDLTLNMYSQIASTSHNLVLELWGTTVGGWASPVTLGTNEQYYLQMNLSLVVTWNSQQKTLTQATWKRMNTGGSLLAYDVVYAPWSPITVTTKDISTALTIALKDYGTQNWYSQYRWTLKKS